MKLTKEQVYISLQGKTKEELTDLYWLLKNNNQDLFHKYLPTFIEEYYKTSRFLEFYSGKWGGGDNLKTEVTIEQLKEILQYMEDKEPKSNELKALLEIYYSCRNKYIVINKDEVFKKYNCVNSEYMSVCLKKNNLINMKGRRSKWIESKPNENMADYFLKFVQDYVKTKNKKKYLESKNNNITELNLTERIEKAEAEVKRLQSLIEEQNKPKINDWVYNKEEDIIYQKSYNIFNQYENKITSPELIKLLEQEIK